MGMTNYNFGLIAYTDVHQENIDANYFLAGSPDGICIQNSDPSGEPILIEVKCPYRRKIVMNKCPKYYYPQVQLNLFITGIKKADFIEYKPADYNGGEILNIVRIHIDPVWLCENIPILFDFWKDVEHYRNVGIETHPKFKTPGKTIDVVSDEEPTESVEFRE